MIEVVGMEPGAAQPEEPVPGTWVRVVGPTDKDVEYLRRTLGLSRLFIAYALDTDELARIERDDGHTLIILRVPHHLRGEEEPPFITTTLAIVLVGETLVTICKYRTTVLETVLEQGGAELVGTDMAQAILLILVASAERFLQGLRAINRLLGEAEERIDGTPKDEMVLDMLRYRRTLTYFVTAIKSNRNMLEVLARQENYSESPEHAALLDDVMLEYDQAEETSQVAADVVDQYTSALGALIANALNKIMKFLSSFAIIFSVPVIIAGFYGMNVSLPFENHRWAFGIVVGVSFGLALAVAYLFQKRNLL